MKIKQTEKKLNQAGEYALNKRICCFQQSETGKRPSTNKNSLCCCFLLYPECQWNILNYYPTERKKKKKGDMTKKVESFDDLCTTAGRRQWESFRSKKLFNPFCLHFKKNILITYWKMSLFKEFSLPSVIGRRNYDFPSCLAPQEGGNSKN